MKHSYCLVVGTVTKSPTNKDAHENNVDDLAKFLKEQYKDEFLIFDLTFVFLSVLILSSLLGEMAQFFGHTVRFSLNNISLDSVFRILYAIDYWNNNPIHCGTNSS